MAQSRFAAVRNAADPKQVKFGERLERRRQERYYGALGAVLNTVEGRIVVASLLRRAGVYRSVWHPSAEIHYNAGRQDYGHELMADIIDVSETAWQTMEREQWAWAKAQEREIAAQHTPRATSAAQIDGAQEPD